MTSLDSLLETAGVESAKRHKVAETAEDLLSRLSMTAATAAVAKNDEKWEARLSGLTVSYEGKCDEKIAQSEARTKSMSDSLVEKVGSLEKSMSTFHVPDPWSSYRSNGQQPQSHQSSFVPSKVGIKGLGQEKTISRSCLSHAVPPRYTFEASGISPRKCRC